MARPETADQSESTRPRRYQTFQYAKPEGHDAAQAVVELCLGKSLDGAMHVVATGGGTNLHSQTGAEEFWMVIKGRARFLGPGRTVMGEFEPGDGLLIARNTPFRYENIGDDDLELICVASARPGIANERIDAEPPEPEKIARFSGRVL